MATRSEKLNRLVIQSPCKKSWEEMTGGDAERHCAECDRQVFDFRRMTPRQITTRIQATGGHLCARLTRGSDGRLLTLEPPFEPMAPSSWTAHRASPVAAAVVSTLLGLGAATAKPLPETPPAAASTSDPNRASDAKATGGGTALVSGIVHDEGGAPQAGFQILAINNFDGQQSLAVSDAEGAFSFDGLGAGVYSLDISSPTFSAPPVSDLVLQAGENRQIGLTVSPPPDQNSVTSGVISVAQEPLRQVYQESELAVLATVGTTRGIGGDDSGEVVTEMLVDHTFKGRAPKRNLRVYHYSSGDDEGAAYPAGTRVLALLNPRDGEPGPAFEPADFTFGLTPLSEAELPVFRERLDALARISESGGPLPVDLGEWLVATAEEPLTRKLVTSEIINDLWALDEFAQAKGLASEEAAGKLRSVVDHFLAEGKSFANEPSAEMVAAFFDEGQQERLLDALDATHSVTDGDLELFSIVKTFDSEAALAWAARTIRELKPESSDILVDTLERLAAELENPALEALADSASDALAEIDEDQPDDELTPEAASLQKSRSDALRQELIRNFQEALEAPR